MAERIPIAFLAGVLSVVTPCVLPLVPGYLSAVSAVEADRLGERGMARRIVVASIPFFIGFTVVFVALGAGSSRDRRPWSTPASQRDRRLRARRPRPRVHGPAALAGADRRAGHARRRQAIGLERAARRGVRRLRRALHRHGARVGARARRRLRHRRARLGPALRLLGRHRRRSCSAGIAFARAMGAFRWLRDHYIVIRVVERGNPRRARAAALLPPRLVAARDGQPPARRGVGLGEI